MASLPQTSDTDSSGLNSPSDHAERRKDTSEGAEVAELGLDTASGDSTAQELESLLTLEVEDDQGTGEDQEKADDQKEADDQEDICTGIQGGREEEEEEEEETLENQVEDELEHSDQESPFLVAEPPHENLRDEIARMKSQSDDTMGLHTLTPTRPRIRGKPVNLFKYIKSDIRPLNLEQEGLVKPQHKQSRLNYSNQSPGVVGTSAEDGDGKEDTNDNFDTVSDDEDNAEDNAEEITGDNIGDNIDDNDSVDNEDDEISMPKTPSKPRRNMTADPQSLTPSELESPSMPNTPGSWLSRWKYNIMMNHTSMKPPELTETDNEDQPEDTLSFLSFEIGSPGSDQIPYTPTRARTKFLHEELQLNRDSVESEFSDNEPLSNETTVSPAKQGVKRRSGSDEGDYDYGQDDEDAQGEEEVNEDTTGQLEAELSDDSSHFKSDRNFLKPSPFTTVQHIQLKQRALDYSYTPPSKRISMDLSDLKPPRAPVLSVGKAPMYRPDSISGSPSQRRQRPLSFYDKPS
ncbi:hypothetical protein BGZ49_002622 [Haplosporangium sp. Z 27]|nr:hypothetical protein BGZ49_002622 [Haplosporangium sp. Z 27]